jgi:hypothetical protein
VIEELLLDEGWLPGEVLGAEELKSGRLAALFAALGWRIAAQPALNLIEDVGVAEIEREIDEAWVL